MPGYVQIMEFKTSHSEEIRALAEKVQEDLGDAARSTRALFTEDRDRPGHFFAIVEFNSYDEAMEQSNDPRTDARSKRMAALLDDPPTFYNLDVVEMMQG
jgi:hypothetical protein